MKVWGIWFRVKGSGVQDLGFRIYGFRFRV